MSITEGKYGKSLYTGPVHLYGVYRSDLGGWYRVCPRSEWTRSRKGFVGWVERLDAEKNEERYLMIEVRPEGHKDRLDSDITLNRMDMRSKFGYTMLSEITVFNGRALDIFL